MVGIDLVKSLVNFFFKNFDGYITGSLGPTGSQIRKKKSWITFFIFIVASNLKNTSYGIKIKASKSGLRIFITKKTLRVLFRQVKPGVWPILLYAWALKAVGNHITSESWEWCPRLSFELANCQKIHGYAPGWIEGSCGACKHGLKPAVGTDRGVAVLGRNAECGGRWQEFQNVLSWQLWPAPVIKRLGDLLVNLQYFTSNMATTGHELSLLPLSVIDFVNGVCRSPVDRAP